MNRGRTNSATAAPRGTPGGGYADPVRSPRRRPRAGLALLVFLRSVRTETGHRHTLARHRVEVTAESQQGAGGSQVHGLGQLVEVTAESQQGAGTGPHSAGALRVEVTPESQQGAGHGGRVRFGVLVEVTPESQQGAGSHRPRRRCTEVEVTAESQQGAGVAADGLYPAWVEVTAESQQGAGLTPGTHRHAEVENSRESSRCVDDRDVFPCRGAFDSMNRGRTNSATAAPRGTPGGGYADPVRSPRRRPRAGLALLVFLRSVRTETGHRHTLARHRVEVTPESQQGAGRKPAGRRRGRVEVTAESQQGAGGGNRPRQPALVEVTPESQQGAGNHQQPRGLRVVEVTPESQQGAGTARHNPQ